MAKEKKYDREVDECLEKMLDLLREYGCKIEFDDELGKVTIHDRHTKEFSVINNTSFGGKLKNNTRE